MDFPYFNRDISWLSFNNRVLDEAEKKSVPLMERINYLSIYSSNLDEFYRVRIPTLMALNQVKSDETAMPDLIKEIEDVVAAQQERFGRVLRTEIVPALRRRNVEFLYDTKLPLSLKRGLLNFFFTEVASYVRLVKLKRKEEFFPENNKLYIFVKARKKKSDDVTFVVNIPSDLMPRFRKIEHNKKTYIIFLDDIVKLGMRHVLAEYRIKYSCNVKITRSAELEISDEYEGDLAMKISRELEKRDQGLATRILYEGSVATENLEEIRRRFGLKKATLVKGGPYHQLRDLRELPLDEPVFYYKPWPRKEINFNGVSIFDVVRESPFLLHTPYHSFDPLVRFFNEASMNNNVTAIYTTIYRIAKNSRMAHALINAAKSGKKVFVFVELKARFDEENNLRWAKKMESAGVRIIFSLPGLKVHCKVALVKMKDDENRLFGILGTGNFHEENASIYTDHFLFTADQGMLSEIENLFRFFKIRKKGLSAKDLQFSKLLVGQFNLQGRFIELIDGEIANVKKGLPASIILKLNALEDAVLINKLYEASQAGVKVDAIVRGICCLVPGVAGLSDNIVVRRIVDRYLEHGRVFVFGNNNDPLVFLGSSDWMTRSMKRRIEVCFPLDIVELRNEMIKHLEILLADEVQAVQIDASGRNQPMAFSSTGSRHAQKEISKWLSGTRQGK